MLKKLIIALTTITIVLSLTACQSHSEKNIHELIKTLNSAYQYNLNTSDFIIEKSENIIYHKITNDKNILSFYCNKNGEIIQCTLSSFDINNPDNCKIMSAIGSILTQEKEKNIESILKDPHNHTGFNKHNWKIYIVKNSLGITYIIKQEISESGQKPTLKNEIY